MMKIIYYVVYSDQGCQMSVKLGLHMDHVGTELVKSNYVTFWDHFCVLVLLFFVCFFCCFFLACWANISFCYLFRWAVIVNKKRYLKIWPSFILQSPSYSSQICNFRKHCISLLVLNWSCVSVWEMIGFRENPHLPFQNEA